MESDVFDSIPAPVREFLKAELDARRKARFEEYVCERGKHDQDMSSRGLCGTGVASGGFFSLLCHRWEADLKDEVSTWVPAFFKYAPQRLDDLKARLLATDYAADPEYVDRVRRYDSIGIPVKMHLLLQELKEFLKGKAAIFDREVKKCRAEEYEREQTGVDGKLGFQKPPPAPGTAAPEAVTFPHPSVPLPLKEIAKAVDMDADTLSARLKEGKVRYKKLSRQQYIVCLDDLGYTEGILDAEDKLSEILERRTE